ncbi:GntR family transcriptional regulator [Nocardioides sp. CFH 31398]|uniref:GntR family transcriptional regulator n=1 Tax=Nocardioides sp. CFH 31398 TaxID=2919579 RepID=UPI001F06A0BD|nr:GntR family transcriptional regulator [Nocardioides sp. CFH 31398]MCH1866930.1 GntR family transcriptional regulator [Nocardioides sp. CFH 31398]
MGKLADTVVTRLRGGIVDGTYAPGTRLVEADLCREFGVSRVPVREALRHLEAEGFVVSRPYAGVRVARFGPDEAADLFAVRRALEETTARRAATRMRDRTSVAGRDPGLEELGERLTSLVAMGHTALREWPEEVAALNTSFHATIAELSGSTVLVSLFRQVAAKIEWLYAMDVGVRGPHSWSEHAAIAEAVTAGDPERAAALMAEHVEASLTGYLLRHAPQ